MKTAAIFDVDGTLVQGTIVNYYLFLLRQRLFGIKKGLKLFSTALKAPYWWMLDKIDRSLFNRSFYSCYRGWGARECRDGIQKDFYEIFISRLIPETIEKLNIHRERGDFILLVSGSLDFILAPLAQYLGVQGVIAARLEEREGIFSGFLADPPVIGDEKSRRLEEFALCHGLDLNQSYAYGDSLSDLPLLNRVGHPVAVNPHGKFRRIARMKGWEIMKTHSPKPARSGAGKDPSQPQMRWKGGAVWR